MKVLAAIVVPPHLSASGAARAGLRLSDALAAHCEITVAAMCKIDSDRPSRARRVAVRSWVPLPFRALPGRYRSLFYVSDIPRTIERGNFDLVHLHNPMPALEMARIARACVRSRIPYVVSTHGFNEIANGEVIYRLGLGARQAWKVCVSAPIRRAVEQAASIFALSPADFPIVKSFGYAGAPVVVPNGVDLPAPGTSGQDRETWRRLGLPPREDFPGIACMFLGNHTPNKGVPVLLEAFSRLDCPYLLIVVGEPRPDIDYHRFTRHLRPDQRVVLTGRLSDRDVGAAFRRSDLFVFPTLADTFPLVVLEAMAHGVPVLASDVGGIPYQLTDECGELTRPGDPASLAAAVRRFALDPARLHSMGAYARDRAATEFSWEAAAKSALLGYEGIGPSHFASGSRRLAPVEQSIG